MENRHTVLGKYVTRGVTRIFQGERGGSHWVKQYRHGVFAAEYCRGSQRGDHGHPRTPPTPLVTRAPLCAPSFNGS